MVNTHRCPTCQHKHEPLPDLMGGVTAVLALIVDSAKEVGAPIRSVGLAPKFVSIIIGTECGLRKLAAEIGFPEPGLDDTGLLETQSVYAGVFVGLYCHPGGDQ